MVEENDTYRHFTPLNINLIRCFFLQPISSSLFPVADQTNIADLVGTAHNSSTKGCFADVVYSMPIYGLEYRMVHLTGASDLFFVRFRFSNDNWLFPFPSSLYFCFYYISPLSICLFGLLNMLTSCSTNSIFKGTVTDLYRNCTHMYHFSWISNVSVILYSGNF